jgi:hypothetical protein
MREGIELQLDALKRAHSQTLLREMLPKARSPRRVMRLSCLPKPGNENRSRIC